MAALNDEQQARLRELLQEKSLWQVYVTSCRIRFSTINISLGAVVGVVVALAVRQAKSATVVADELLELSAMAFSLSIGQLGFLLAGFSFFATVADKELFCRMAEKTHEDSGLSYLKYNFFVFMRVFVEYLVFSMVCLGLMVILTKDIGIREAVARWLDQWVGAKRWVAAGSFGLFVGCVVYLLMQLASFIYNIFHVVMTAIRWELQRDYVSKNEAVATQQSSAEMDRAEALSVAQREGSSVELPPQAGADAT